MPTYVDAKNKAEALRKTGADSAVQVDNGGGEVKRWACFETAEDRRVWDKNVYAAAALLGSATTPKKAAAARENGKAGGAPRLCECGHKRARHPEWKHCDDCACILYQARD